MSPNITQVTLYTRNKILSPILKKRQKSDSVESFTRGRREERNDALNQSALHIPRKHSKTFLVLSFVPLRLWCSLFAYRRAFLFLSTHSSIYKAKHPPPAGCYHCYQLCPFMARFHFKLICLEPDGIVWYNNTNVFVYTCVCIYIYVGVPSKLRRMVYETNIDHITTFIFFIKNVQWKHFVTKKNVCLSDTWRPAKVSCSLI